MIATIPRSMAQVGGGAGGGGVNSTTIAPDSSQSSSSKPPTAKMTILIALLLSVLEPVLSTTNAVQDDAFRLTNFEGYVYAASSVMELVGLLRGLVCYLDSEWDSRLLGLPLIVMSTGVVEDDWDRRLIGFGGTVCQAGFIFLLLLVWLCLTIDWFFWVVVAAFSTMTCCYLCRSSVNILHAGISYNGPPPALPLALTNGEIEIEGWPRYLSLPFSPVVIEFLEGYFLLKNFSIFKLGLLVVDVLTVLPGFLWLVVQVLNAFKECILP